MTTLDGSQLNAITILGVVARAAADRIIDAAAGHPRQAEIEAALVDLAREHVAQGRRIGHAIADRDRQVAEASRRAEDCVAHGEEIRYMAHQAHYLWLYGRVVNEQRVAWVDACHRIVDGLRRSGHPDLAAAAQELVDGAGRAQSAAATRAKAPTLADCQAAGRCEHPETPPHAACQQLTLFHTTT